MGNVLADRIGVERTQKLMKARVGIAGLGGLGSNIAVMLARSGIGTLHLVDFDVVDESNLNRQHYFEQHLGRKKTVALAEQLLQINPHLEILIDNVKVTESNAVRLFAADPLICEAFDKPDSKALLATSVLTELPNALLVSGNGMAGLAPASTVITKQVNNRFWICGDGASDVADNALYSPRVTLCAAQQALVVLRLVLGLDPLTD